MKQTITRLASHIIDLAEEVGIDAATLAVDPGIAGAEAVRHLRDALRSLNAAKDGDYFGSRAANCDPLAGSA